MDSRDRASGTRRKVLEDQLPAVRSERTIDSSLNLPPTFSGGKTVYLPRDFRIPLDEAMLADSSSILQGKVRSPIALNFSSALAAHFGFVGVHPPIITLVAQYSYTRFTVLFDALQRR